MSLNWDLSAIKDRDDFVWVEAKEDDPSRGIKAGEKRMSPVTNALIWATLSVGWGEITEKNHVDWFHRLRLVELITGPTLNRAANGRVISGHSITLEDVRRHIGLRTNVFPKKTDAEFYKQLVSFAEGSGTFKDKEPA